MQESIAGSCRDYLKAHHELYPGAIEMWERALEDEFTIDGHLSYRDVFLQSFGKHARSPEVAGLLMLFVHRDVVNGDSSVVGIHVGSKPKANLEAEANTQALANLPAPFTTTMRFGQADSDGLLEWPEGDPARPFPGPLTSVPIEVGHTDVETLWWHYNQCGGFARWPFGSEWMVVFGKHEPRPAARD